MQTQFGIVGAENCTVTIITTDQEDAKFCTFDSGKAIPEAQQKTLRTTAARKKLATQGAEGLSVFPL